MNTNWREQAEAFLEKFLQENPAKIFLTEELRECAYKNNLPHPPDERIWGRIMQSASKDGLVVKQGYGLAKSSNMTAKIRWISAT